MASMKYDIPLLDRSTRFSLWQVKMRAVLAQLDLDDVLLGIDKMPTTLTAEEKLRKDKKAISHIHLHLSNTILQDVLKENSAAALWLRLEQLCMTKSLTSKLNLKQRLYSHRMTEGGSLEDHLAVFKEIVADLETLEVEYDEEDLALILLCSLPASFSSFRDTILYSRDTLTIEEVYDALYSKEKMKHLVSEARYGEGLIAHGGSGRGRSKTKFSNQICNYCKKKGHLKKDCYKLQNKERMAASRHSETSGEADIAENVVSDGELLAISDIESKPEEDWILDSACVFHMCPNKDLFATYETVSKGVVVMGNNASCRVAGIGTVRLKLLDGTIRTLGQVRHVPELKKNLISLSTLDSKGYEFFGGGGALKVCKGAQIVLEGHKRSQLYILQGRAESRKVNQHRFSTVMDIQFGTIPLGAHKWSNLKNTTKWNFEDIGNAALPSSPAVPLYSIARDRPSGTRYVDVDFVEHALNGVEGVQSSKGPSVKAFGNDSTLGCVTTHFG